MKRSGLKKRTWVLLPALFAIGFTQYGCSDASQEDEGSGAGAEAAADTTAQVSTPADPVADPAPQIVDTSTDADTAATVTTPPDASAYSLQVSTRYLDGQSAKGEPPESYDPKTLKIKCDAGYYVSEVVAQASSWGLYPAITWIRLECKSPEGHTHTVEGGKSNMNAYAMATSCKKDEATDQVGNYDYGEFITGLNILDDRFIKNLRVQCAQTYVGNKSDGTLEFKAINRTYSTAFLFTRYEANDDNANLECNGEDKVLTGIQAEYIEDNNEAALTSIKLYCSKVVPVAQ